MSDNNYQYKESDRLSSLIAEVQKSGGLHRDLQSLYTISFTNNTKQSESLVEKDYDALEVLYYQIDTLNNVECRHGTFASNSLPNYRVSVITKSPHAPRWFSFLSQINKKAQKDNIRICQFNVLNSKQKTSADTSISKPKKYSTIEFNNGVFNAYITYKSSIVYGNTYGITFFIEKMTHIVTEYKADLTKRIRSMYSLGHPIEISKREIQKK